MTYGWLFTLELALCSFSNNFLITMWIDNKIVEKRDNDNGNDNNNDNKYTGSRDDDSSSKNSM